MESNWSRVGENRPVADNASSEGPPLKEKSLEVLVADRLDLGTCKVCLWTSLGLSDGGARSGKVPKDGPGDKGFGDEKRGND